MQGEVKRHGERCEQYAGTAGNGHGKANSKKPAVSFENVASRLPPLGSLLGAEVADPLEIERGYGCEAVRVAVNDVELVLGAQEMERETGIAGVYAIKRIGAIEHSARRDRRRKVRGLERVGQIAADDPAYAEVQRRVLAELPVQARALQPLLGERLGCER